MSFVSNAFGHLVGRSAAPDLLQPHGAPVAATASAATASAAAAAVAAEPVKVEWKPSKGDLQEVAFKSVVNGAAVSVAFSLPMQFAVFLRGSTGAPMLAKVLSCFTAMVAAGSFPSVKKALEVQAGVVSTPTDSDVAKLALPMAVVAGAFTAFKLSPVVVKHLGELFAPALLKPALGVVASGTAAGLAAGVNEADARRRAAESPEHDPGQPVTPAQLGALFAAGQAPRVAADWLGLAQGKPPPAAVKHPLFGPIVTALGVLAANYTAGSMRTYTKENPSKSQ